MCLEKICSIDFSSYIAKVWDFPWQCLWASKFCTGLEEKCGARVVLKSQRLKAVICEAEAPRPWVVPRRKVWRQQGCGSAGLPLAPLPLKWLLLMLHLGLVLRLGLGLEKTTKPRAPGALQLQKACQWEHGTATTLFSQLSPWHRPCAGNLSLTNDFSYFST